MSDLNRPGVPDPSEDEDLQSTEERLAEQVGVEPAEPADSDSPLGDVPPPPD